MKRQTKILTMALLLSVTAAVGARQAHAVPILSLDDGTNFVTVVDNGAGDDNALVGLIDYSAPGGTFTNFMAAISIGTTKPVIGSAGLPHLDLASVNVTSLTATSDVLTIKFTDTDFSTPLPGAISFKSEIGGVTEGTVTYKTYYDNSNTAFGEAELLADLGPFSGGAFSATDYVPLSTLAPAPTDPYSITLVTTVSNTDGAAKITSYNASVTVPEPGTLLLLGSGMLGFAFLRRKKS